MDRGVMERVPGLRGSSDGSKRRCLGIAAWGRRLVLGLGMLFSSVSQAAVDDVTPRLDCNAVLVATSIELPLERERVRRIYGINVTSHSSLLVTVAIADGVLDAVPDEPAAWISYWTKELLSEQGESEIGSLTRDRTVMDVDKVFVLVVDPFNYPGRVKVSVSRIGGQRQDLLVRVEAD